MSILAFLTRDIGSENIDFWIGHKPVLVGDEFFPRTARGKFMRVADQQVVEMFSRETGFHISEGEIWEFSLSPNRQLESGDQLDFVLLGVGD